MVDWRVHTRRVARCPLEQNAEEAGGRKKVVSIHPGFRVESGEWLDMFVPDRPLEEE